MPENLFLTEREKAEFKREVDFIETIEEELMKLGIDQPYAVIEKLCDLGVMCFDRDNSLQELNANEDTSVSIQCSITINQNFNMENI